MDQEPDKRKDKKEKKKKNKKVKRSPSPNLQDAIQKKKQKKEKKSKKKSRSKSKPKPQMEIPRKPSQKKNTDINDDPNKQAQKKKSESKFRFDSPPKDPLMGQISASISSANLQLGGLEALLPSNPLANPMASLEALQAMNPLIMMQRLQQIRAQSDVKADRKLYVGNLPPNTTQMELQEYLNQTLLKMGVNTENGVGSIINSWINSDGHFGFVEFRTPEEATQGFCLNNVVFNGQALKIGRPKSFLTQLASANQSSNKDQPINPLSNFKISNSDLSTANFKPLQLKNSTIQVPTNILILKNALTMDDLTIDEEYYEIIEDIKEECLKYGMVKSIIVPRPEAGQIVCGCGKVFIEFENEHQARWARKNISGRLYGDQTVECAYLSPIKFGLKDFNESLDL